MNTKEWVWFGSPGHFIGARYCHFHLCTRVGKYLVSTVGEYRPDGVEGNNTEIGLNRLYETMVFLAGKPAPCCGIPEISGEDVDFAGYNTCGEATLGHSSMCDKWDI